MHAQCFCWRSLTFPPLPGTFARFWSEWGVLLECWLPHREQGRISVHSSLAGATQFSSHSLAGATQPSSHSLAGAQPFSYSLAGATQSQCSSHGLICASHTSSSAQPPAFRLLSKLQRIPDQPDAYWGSMEELWHFVTVLETETNTSFSIETCRVPGESEVVLRLNCHAGGKESWVVRKSRKEQECTQCPNAAGQSRKGRCTTHIKIRVPLGMAQEAGYAICLLLPLALPLPLLLPLRSCWLCTYTMPGSRRDGSAPTPLWGWMPHIRPTSMASPCSWQPQYLMLDKSDAELNAICNVFPTATPLL